MTQFKGTKGKWVQNGENGVHLESGLCIALTYSENRKANALLISRAPEMIEMLEKLVTIEEYLGGSDIEIEIKKLIKEATDL